MYKELLNKLLHHDRIDDLIYPYKPGQPILEFDGKIFTFESTVLREKDDRFDGMIPWIRSLKSHGTSKKSRCIIPRCHNKPTQEGLCSYCREKEGEISTGFLESEIRFKHLELFSGDRKLNHIWYVVGNNSLILFYDYDINTEKIVIRYHDKLSTFSGKYEFVAGDYWYCVICEESHCHYIEDDQQYSSEEYTEYIPTICNNCCSIIKRREK
jgi:hypothetical protein